MLPLVADLPKPPVPDILKPETSIDQPRNLIERALSACPKRTEAGETDCLKAALADQHLRVAELAAIVPGCSGKKLCRYDYTTVDRVGYVPATQSNFVAHWRATFDLTRAAGRIENVSITVVTI